MPTLTTENSFATIEESDSYADNHPDHATWTSQTDDDKARLLITATRILRIVAGYAEADIPDSIKSEMAILQALFLAKYNLALDELMSDNITGKSSKSIGSLTASRWNRSASVANRLHPDVKEMLASYVKPNITLRRG